MESNPKIGRIEEGEENSKETQETIERESDERLKNPTDLNTTDGDDEEENQSSPRGVLEIPISGSDSDNQSNLSRSVSSRGSSFNDKSPATEEDASSGGGGGEGSPTSASPPLQWKNLIDNLKRKSLRRLSTLPLYAMSRKSVKKGLGRNQSSEETVESLDWVIPKPSWRNFTLQELAMATNNFSPDNLVGQGGHAQVYKGCLGDGEVVAVKRITKKEKKDEDRVGDFLTELGIIAHIHHPNAARFIGFSSDTDLHLVLQFAPHGSLATLLHGSEERLEWNLRLKVAVGVAQGLQYLHCDCQRRIIHRDIKPSNILLMEDYQPQISDFGLAKWLPAKWVHHVVSPIEGTFGYMAPEYFMHGIVHEKTDVFAFGVLLLELITGRRAVDSSRQSLVIWAKPLLEQGNVEELVDPRLGDDYVAPEMKRAMWAASSCIHHLPNMRPNMKRVVQILKGESPTVELMRQKTTGGREVLLDACDFDDYSSTTYQKELTRHRELVME